MTESGGTMAENRGCCCDTESRRARVDDCFERGRRRQRNDPPRRGGRPIRARDGTGAIFDIDAVDGRIAGVRFRADSCVTLIAYCERLAEISSGLSVGEGHRIDSETLIASLDGVPRAKRPRAALAIAAWNAALSRIPDGKEAE